MSSIKKAKRTTKSGQGEASRHASTSSYARAPSLPFQCFACHASFMNVNLLHGHIKNSPACSGMKILPGFVAATNLTKQLQPELSTIVQQKTASKGPPDIQVISANGEHASPSKAAKGKGKASSAAAMAIPGTEATAGKTGLGFAVPSSLSSEAPSMARTTSTSSSGTGGAGATKMTHSERRAMKRKQRADAKAAESAVEQSGTTTIAPDRLELPSSDTLNADGLPSPSESIASSTDELAYVSSSAATSRKHTPKPYLDETVKSTKKKKQVRNPPKEKVLPPATVEAQSAVVPSIFPSSSPFAAPVTAFDFLASRMPGLQISQSPPKPSIQSNRALSTSSVAMSHTSSAEGSTASQASLPIPQPVPPQRTLPKPLPPPLISQNSGKRIPQSPLLWGPPRSPAAIDEPTFGSPSIDYERPEDDEQEAYGRAITKASHVVGKDAILAALKERIQAAKGGAPAPRAAVPQVAPQHQPQTRQQEEHSGNGAPDLSMVAEGEEDAESDIQLDIEEPTESGDRQAAVEGANGDTDGVVRQDMAYPSLQSQLNDARPLTSASPSKPKPVSAFLRDWNPDVHPTGVEAMARTNAIDQARQARLYSTNAQRRHSPPRQNQQNFINHERQQGADTSALQGVLPVDPPVEQNDRGANTATTTGEEEDSDTAESDNSGTSVMLRGVVRDVDTRGWEQIGRGPSSPSNTGDNAKARLQLDRSIHELNNRHKPSFGTITKRREMIYAIRRKLNGLLKEWRPDFQYDILPFGSTAYGLDRDSSDLDLCIIDPKRPDGFRNAFDLYEIDANESGHQPEQMASTDDNEDVLTEQEKQRRNQRPPWATDRKTELGLDAIYEPRRLAGVLRRMGFREVIPIPSAGVPIVKFKSEEGIKADMNANEQLGVRNSALLATYVNFSPLVRPFLIFLKAWAKQRGLNDPSGAHGAMSLSSYSLVLMAIGYMQHIGLVPNLQSIDLVEKSGMKREAFWTKVPNKNAVKPGARGRARYLGDFRAMVVDTTFVRKMPGGSGWKARYPADPAQSAALRTGGTENGTTKKGKTKGLGWESDNSDVSRPQDTHRGSNNASSSSQSTEVVDLLQGFFNYYLKFPLESRAVSIWAGKPLARGMGYMPLAVDEAGEVLPQLPKITREEREELYEEELEEDGEEIYQHKSTAHEIASEQTANHVEIEQPASDLDESDDEAATRARLAQIDAILKAQGIDTQSIPSFEETHLLESQRRQTADQALAVQEVSESQFPETTPNTPTRHRTISSTTARATPKSRNVATHTGLELHHADEQNHLFPFPDVEDPATFQEPPTWTQKLVVQDPFIHTRNTCLNIIPKVVDRILLEMQRAHDLLEQSAPLDKICLNIEKDAEYSSLLTTTTGLFPSRAAKRLSRQNQKREARRRDEQYAREREARRIADGTVPRSATNGGQGTPGGRGGDRGASRRQRGNERYEKLKQKRKGNRSGNAGSGAEQIQRNVEQRPRSPDRQ